MSSFLPMRSGVEKSPGRMGLAAGAAGIGACFPVFPEGPAAMRAVAGALNRWRSLYKTAVVTRWAVKAIQPSCGRRKCTPFGG